MQSRKKALDKRKLIPSFPYPGGKATLSSEIVKYIPKQGRKFVDLFGGRGNILFRAIHEGLNYREWVINDIQTAGFFRAIRDYGDKFQATELTKEEYVRCAELAKRSDPHALIMEPFLSFNGGRYHVNGMRGSGGGRRSPDGYTRIVRIAHEYLREKNVRVTELDWLDCLRAEKLTATDFVAIDSPYISGDVDTYRADTVSPVEMIEHLRSAEFPWLFCEYSQPLYVAAFGEPIFTKSVQLRSAQIRRVKESRTECVWLHDLSVGPSVTVTVPTPVPEGRSQRYYRKLSVEGLLEEIKQCMGSVDYSRNQMSKEMRDRLLPALLELRRRTYRKKPGYYESLAELGLNADTVRQWFYRGYTGDEVIKSLEDQEPESPQTKHRDGRSEEEVLLEYADRMANAILEGKPTYAKKLATQYLDARKEGRLWQGAGQRP